MIYSAVKGKGIKKKGIPPPCEVELPLSASYDEVLLAGKENFFEDDDEVVLQHLTLADSTGSRIKVKDKDMWTIVEFYSKKDLKPSRYKLYVMYVPPVSFCAINKVVCVKCFEGCVLFAGLRLRY